MSLSTITLLRAGVSVNEETAVAALTAPLCDDMVLMLRPAEREVIDAHLTATCDEKA